MHAIIQTGGKQYRVEEGLTIKVEMLPHEENAEVIFDNVLLIANGDQVTIGQPYVSGAKVTAKLLENSRLGKINIIKYKRRKHHKKQMGHRQYYSAVKIEKISAA